LRLSAKISGLVQPLQTLLRPSIGEQSAHFQAHRRYLDGQLGLAIACLTILPVVLLTLGAQTPLVAVLGGVLGLSLLGIISVTHLKSLTLPNLAWALGTASGVMMFAAFHQAFVAGVAVCLCVLGFEGGLRDGMRGVLVGLALSLAAALLTLVAKPVGTPHAFMMSAAPWVLVAFGGAFCVWTGIRISHRFVSAETKLQRERDRFHLMADHSTDLITRHNARGRTMFASAASTQIIGFAPKALLDTGLLEKIHLQDRVQFLRAISRAANEGQTSCMKLRIRARLSDTPDWVHVEMRCRPFATANGGRDGAVISSRDITAEIVANQQIQMAEAEAKAANAAQRRFLMTMSHELRTPLSAIIGFSDMLSLKGTEAPSADQQKDYVEIIQQSGLHLLQVVNGLLDLSRIEAGKYELTLERFHLSEIAQTSIRMLSMQARDAKVHVRLQAAEDLPQITADRGAVQQVLINLVSNAIKFSRPEGRVAIDIKLSGRSFQVRVKDEGIGISADGVEKLGEPFWQAESGSARSHEGSGLGLSVVRGLVDLHHGSVGFKSKPGLGTTVTVVLPVTAGKAQPVPEDADRSLVRLSSSALAEPASRSGGASTPRKSNSPSKSSVTTEGQRHARVSA